MFETAKGRTVTFNVIGNGAIRQAKYEHMICSSSIASLSCTNF